MSMSVDGLISGMDTTALITKLLQVEALPQTALKQRLSASEISASAYRTVNTTFLAVTSAAEAVLKSDSWNPTKATASPGVTVSSTNGALGGSLSFTVDRLATSHSLVFRNTGTWTSAESAYGASDIEIFDAGGASKGTITIGGTGTLADAAAAINAATDLRLSASVVQLDSGEASLRITSKDTGQASRFTVSGPGTAQENTRGVDAQITIGTDDTLTVTSATNTFDSVLPGASFTVSKAGADQLTITVAPDPDTVAAKVQAMVDAVNAAVGTVKKYTDNSKGSTAALKGDYSVAQLSGQLLDAVSFAIGADGSPAKVGFELTRDGKVEFDKAKFLAALEDDPALAQRMVGGTAAGPGADGVRGNVDDVAATGIAGRLLQVATRASDNTTGFLVKMAEGQDDLAKDLQDKIDGWDIRLAKRKETLTRQFTAMEVALSSLKNQSTWLAGQINGLPTWE